MSCFLKIIPNWYFRIIISIIHSHTTSYACLFQQELIGFSFLFFSSFACPWVTLGDPPWLAFNLARVNSFKVSPRVVEFSRLTAVTLSESEPSKFKKDLSLWGLPQRRRQEETDQSVVASFDYDIFLFCRAIGMWSDSFVYYFAW